MFIHLFVEILAVVAGYSLVSKYIVPSKRWWGFVVFFVTTLALPGLSMFIGPWPIGIPLFLSAYVAMGVGIKAFYKPDISDDQRKGTGGKGTLKA